MSAPSRFRTCGLHCSAGDVSVSRHAGSMAVSASGSLDWLLASPVGATLRIVGEAAVASVFAGGCPHSPGSGSPDS